jgi:hypothetical protein
MKRGINGWKNPLAPASIGIMFLSHLLFIPVGLSLLRSYSYLWYFTIIMGTENHG